MKLFLIIAALACLLASGTATVLTMQPNAGRSRPVPRLLIGAPKEGQSGPARRRLWLVAARTAEPAAGTPFSHLRAEAPVVIVQPSGKQESRPEVAIDAGAAALSGARGRAGVPHPRRKRTCSEGP
jgi:hypothetical protein